MKHLEWIVLSGRAVAEETTIKFSPARVQKPIKKGTSSENTVETDDNTQPQATVSSNEDFENGEINFTAKLNEPTALCQVKLQTISGPDLHIGVTGIDRFDISTYDKKEREWAFKSKAGRIRETEESKKFRLRIIVRGSLIQLYANGVLVCTATEQIAKSQVTFRFVSSKEIDVDGILISTKKPKAFVVMQFTDDYNQLYQEVIKPVCEQYGLDVERADESYTTNTIIEDMVQSIKESSIIIAEITPDNPNVFYEVGYSHAISKPTILLCDRKRPKLPFDLSSFRTLFYDNTIAGKSAVELKLRKYLDAIFQSK